MPAKPARLNREWHLANPMPKRATLDERVDWHRRHQEACACRAAPAAIQAEIDRRKRR